ncbi:MAG: hypothetical protein ACOVNY_12625 [Chitinophagaceae bacterium]
MQYWHKSIQAFFLGNYFYGICAVMLAFEACIQLQISSTVPYSVYLIIFCVTVLYYTYAYTSILHKKSSNTREAWYAQHATNILISQKIIFGITLLAIAHFVSTNFHQWQIPSFKVIIVCFSILLLVLFYNNWYMNTHLMNLRNLGLLKPFIIGYVWSGLVMFFPIFIAKLLDKSVVVDHWQTAILFIKNGMFISVLSMMFDIKDYSADYNQQLKTFVVRIGLRKTIYFLLLPLSFLGLFSYWLLAFTKPESATTIFFNSIPFILLIIVALSLQQRKTILYYLAVIDGLMFIKALCGIIAITF